MSVFNPSAEFPKRWLATPLIAKQAFHQELDDIIALLKSDRPTQEFAFSCPDFNDEIGKLLHVYEGTKTVSTPTKTISTEEVHALEDVIYKKLSNQLDDFLSDEMARQSEDLKIWLKNLIKEELSSFSGSAT